MLDLKALLLKLTRYVGSDYIVNYNNYTSATDIASCITNNITDIASSANSLVPVGDMSYARPIRVGRHSSSDGVEWAWKITYLNTTSTFYPIWYNNTTTYTNSSATSSNGWDFVEIYAKFPTQVITRNVDTGRTYYKGYTKNTPTGTATAAFGACNKLEEYSWPFPSSFFGGYIPASIGGAHGVASPAISRFWGNGSISTGNYFYDTYAYSNISSAGTATTKYDVPLFSYMFFTRPHQD